MMDQHSPSPDTRKKAPGTLALVQAFVNTTDLEEGKDEFSSPEALHSWFVDHDLIDTISLLNDADLRLAIQVREGLRSLALANHNGEMDTQAVTSLNSVALGLRLAVRFDEQGRAHLEPSLPGIDGALAAILGVVYAAMAQGTWPRLKACRKETCRWLFYDRSKNRSSTWCSMSVCGNREKARTYRRRRQAP